MPPITFIAAEPFTEDLVGPVPRRAKPDDVLLAVVLTTHTATLTPPAGWVELTRVSAPANAAAAVWLLRHRVDEAEPASHAFAVSGGDAWGVVLLYRGLAELDGVVDGSAADDASGGSHAIPIAQTSTYSDILLGVWASFSTSTWTAPVGMVERFNDESPDVGVAAHILIADVLPEAVGAVGGDTAGSTPNCTALAGALLLAASPPPRAVAIDRPTPGAIGIQEI